MQTKLTTALLLAAGALLASAGCSHQASTPAAAVPTANPNPISPTQAANQALNNPNTSPETKRYLEEHQAQIHQGQAAPTQAKPMGGQ